MEAEERSSVQQQQQQRQQQFGSSARPTRSIISDDERTASPPPPPPSSSPTLIIDATCNGDADLPPLNGGGADEPKPTLILPAPPPPPPPRSSPPPPPETDAESSAHPLQQRRRRRHVICMVSDFFYPRLGGVEGHIWALSQCLLAMGHKVIVVTGTYAGPRPHPGAPNGSSSLGNIGAPNTSDGGGNSGAPNSSDGGGNSGSSSDGSSSGAHGVRAGVRTMTHGLKVYYLPLPPCFDQAVFPSYFSGLSLFRRILLREGVSIVHGHAATSVLAHECLLAACLLGVRTVFTDHSLFGFSDFASINVNKYLKLSLAAVDACVSVSHTGRENLCLRAALDPSAVWAIPNAVDASVFTPCASARPPRGGVVNVVMLSRLVYRKGIDLAVRVIPLVCARRPDVRFIIGGDGPKRLLLEEMRDAHGLHDRVELLGAVPHARVRDVLVRGHVFLNASLTEAFCIAILEAACCGCFVVSTRVGGVPEVLPARMIRFAEPEAGDLADALCEALPLAVASDPDSFHAELAGRYSWPDVAARTVAVYDAVAGGAPLPLVERLRRWAGVGAVFGAVAAVLMALLFVFCAVLEAADPREGVERAWEWERGRGGDARVSSGGAEPEGGASGGGSM